MTPEQLKKIRALVDDPTTDPGTRDVARQTLERFSDLPPLGVHPGLRHTPEYDRWKAAVKRGDKRGRG